MKNMTRLLLIAFLALPLVACKKEAPQQAATAALTAPADPNDHQGWNNYLSDVVTRNMGGIQNQPYVYTLPPESDPGFQGSYERQLEKAKMDVARGIISGNLLAYGGPTSAKMADLVVESFKEVPAGTMKGVKVLFIGKAADNERVKTAVAPAGVDYVFIEAK